MGVGDPVRSLPEALQRLGRGPGDLSRHPILHGATGTLLVLAVPGADGTPQWAGVWVSEAPPVFLLPVEVPTRVSIAHGIDGPAARLVDLFAEAIRRYLEEAERLDVEVAALQAQGIRAPVAEVWRLHRASANLRGWVDRALVVAGEAGGPFAGAFAGGLDRVLPSVERELERVRALAVGVQQSLSDLILMRNAEQSNRIAETANQLSEFSNRIAVLTNTSNIRMLGITYVALLLGLVSAVVLIPNTAATILGMPSAAWVPGLWVDVILVALAVIPLVVVFSRSWVHRILADLRATEARTAEGLQDLPELEEPGRPGGARPRGAPPRRG
jgi:hypothetical protein